MTSALPLVSVLMPAYNAQAYIDDAIVSILNQSYKNIELIVCDDGSKDLTRKIIQRYTRTHSNVRLLINELNIGIAKTRNKLLDASSGDFVAWLDSDDISLPDRLSIQVDYLLRNKNIFAVGAGRLLITSEGRPIKSLNVSYGTSNPGFNYINIIYRNLFCNSTMMMRNNKYRFDMVYPPAEDYEYWSRLILAKNAKIVNLSLNLVKYRIHNQNTSNQNPYKQLELNDRIVNRNFSLVLKKYPVRTENYHINHHLSEWFEIKHGFINYIKGTLLFVLMLKNVARENKINYHILFITLLIDIYFRIRIVAKKQFLKINENLSH